jgi:hypothetical protein
MIKDILENLIKEIQNEKNQASLYAAIEPFSYKIKTGYLLIVFLLGLIVINLIYSNTLLNEIIKGAKNVRVPT